MNPALISSFIHQHPSVRRPHCAAAAAAASLNKSFSKISWKFVNHPAIKLSFSPCWLLFYSLTHSPALLWITDWLLHAVCRGYKKLIEIAISSRDDCRRTNLGGQKVKSKCAVAPGAGWLHDGLHEDDADARGIYWMQWMRVNEWIGLVPRWQFIPRFSRGTQGFLLIPLHVAAVALFYYLSAVASFVGRPLRKKQ